MLCARVIPWILVAALASLIAAAPAAAAGPQDAIHEVMAGDNLHLIAGYYYGDARQWERIWGANKAQVKNPNLIERGTLLLVPNASVPDTPYAEFAARARREAAERAAAKAAGAPAEAPPVEKEVRVMGEDKPAAPAPTPGATPAPPAGSAAPTPTAPPPAKAPAKAPARPSS